MLRKSLMLFAVAGLLATLGLAASALFTSQATVTDNTFTTGSLVLTASPTSAAITFNNMAPGDQVTAPITLTNVGTLDLRYAMTSTSTNTDNKNLANQLVLSVKSGVTDCSNTGFSASGASVHRRQANLMSIPKQAFARKEAEVFGITDRPGTSCGAGCLENVVKLPRRTRNSASHSDSLTPMPAAPHA